MGSFSIILPFYNRKNFLTRAVQSIMNQTIFQKKNLWDAEIILVDDGSTESQQISIEELNLLNTLSLPLQLIQTNHRGVSNARNIGVENSKGEWLFFLDSDDEWHPLKLEKQIEFITKNPKIQIHQTKEIWIRHGKFTNPPMKHLKKSGNLFYESLESCRITFSSVCIHRSLWNQYGGLDKNLPACEDYDLWIAITQNEEIGLVSEFLLTRYGGHEDQLSHTYPVMDRFRLYSLLKRIPEFKKENLSYVQKVIQKKMNILIQGKEKRKKDSKVLKEILNWVQNDFGSNLPGNITNWKNYLLNSKDWKS